MEFILFILEVRVLIFLYIYLLGIMVGGLNIKMNISVYVFEEFSFVIDI